MKQKIENNAIQRKGRTASLCLHHPIPQGSTAQRHWRTPGFKGAPSLGKEEWGEQPTSPVCHITAWKITSAPPYSETEKVKTYRDRLEQQRAAGVPNISYTAEASVVHGNQLCGGSQQVSPLKKPTPRMAVMDPLQISPLYFPPQVSTFTNAT